MKTVRFKGSNSLVITKREGQHVFRDLQNEKVVYCFKLSWKEIFKLLVQRKIWISQNVYRAEKKIQQIYVTVNKDEVIQEK